MKQFFKTISFSQRCNTNMVRVLALGGKINIFSLQLMSTKTIPQHVLENGDEKIQKENIGNQKIKRHDKYHDRVAMFIFSWSAKYSLCRAY